ncbi:unnamed protein product [Pleuronectes platessa]|uniref:Uncharacterized protein n=1 Tax=Pleuronectes platessa TaxID=8262 RepID=A0A9N7Z343_PLEPL|nr:unnamed protein product [Pleuronectes platessa]
MLLPLPLYFPPSNACTAELKSERGGPVYVIQRLAFFTWTSFPSIHLSSKMSEDDCLSPIGLDCCSCCLDLANGCDDSWSGGPAQGLQGTRGALPGSPTSPSVSHFRQLRNQLVYQNLNTDKLNNIMRQDSLESVVRDPCYLFNEGICNSNIDQTMLSILLFFHRAPLLARPSLLSKRLMFLETELKWGREGSDMQRTTAGWNRTRVRCWPRPMGGTPYQPS